MSTIPTIDDLMTQAQVFASAWAIFGSRFDLGDAEAKAEAAKLELQGMIELALAHAAHGRRRVKLEGDAFDCGAALYHAAALPVLDLTLTALDKHAPAGSAAAAREQLLAGFLSGAAAQVSMTVGVSATQRLLLLLAKGTPAAAAAGIAAERGAG